MDLTDSDYAGVDRRLGAYFIDIVLLYLLIAGLSYGLWVGWRGFPFNRLETGWQIEAWVLLTASLPTWLYFALTESSSRGASLGKRLLGLRVTDLELEPIRFSRALMRTLIKLLPWELTHLSILTPTPLPLDPNPKPRLGLILVYILLGLYMVTMIFTPRKRSIHDLLIGTLVLYQGRTEEDEALGVTTQPLDREG